MAYPSKDDYLKAVQRAESFTSDELRRAEFVVHPVWQIPAPAAGSSAVVFKAVLDGAEQALRFPIREDTASRDRYDALREHFLDGDLTANVALARWVDDAIRINGHTWPMVRMEWVNGRAMNQYVAHLVQRRDTASLRCLAQAWRELVLRLQSARFAHGDLQHGNVLVDEHGVLRLVDFDCSWIEGFTGLAPPSETGHRNYQPENRPWGRWMDTFSGLVVYLSLRALAKEPGLWEELNTGENLLFSREDFRAPFDTPVWTRISEIADPELDQLTARLRECCHPAWTATGGLDELLAPRQVPWWELAAASAPQRRRPEPATRPEQTRTAAAPPQRPAEAALPSACTASSDGQTRDWWQRGGDEPARPTVLRTVVRGLLLLAVALLVLFLLIAVIAQVVAQAIL